MHVGILLALAGATIAGAVFAFIANAIAASMSKPLFFGPTKSQGTPLGAVMGLLGFGAGLFLSDAATAFGLALRLGLVGWTAVGSIGFWSVTSVTAPGTNAGLKWSMAGFALLFGAVCGLGASLLTLLA